jgi:hypothetical protein
MITEQQQTAMSNRNKPLQDRKVPLLINIDDGRLVPNVEQTRALENYRLYHGPSNASLADRMNYLRTEYKGMHRFTEVADSGSPPAGTTKPFDIHTASKEELVAFAASEYHKELDLTAHLATLKKQVRELAREAGAFNGDLT